MTFKIDIPMVVYNSWHKPGTQFALYQMERCPEILSISDWELNYKGMYRTFEFESETHYHWFLLKQ